MTNKLPLILGLLLTTACGEKEPEPSAEPSGEPATEPAGEPSEEIIDEDGDGVAQADDCDDTNADLGAIADDADCDGVATADDCDDDDADWGLPTDEVCDGVDNNCDGTVDEGVTTTYYVDLDADGFGSDFSTEEACEAPEGYVDNANDCDDADADKGDAPDEDGDGFMACFDCDDADAMTYPGAAEMDSETECLTDADEDGYGASTKDFGCFTVSGEDSWGDGWNGSAYIDVLVDGVSAGTFTVEDSSNSAEFCVEGSSVNFVYVEGSYTSENTYSITDAGGNVLVAGTPADGSLYSDSFNGGTDCDDSDAGVGTGDTDGDGFDACNTENPNDCDDTDAAINPSVDADADGFSVCDECDDSNADIHPDATEVYYDGVDQNCDGMSDYDADMDGYDAMEYDDGTGTMVEYTGTDCDDSDDDLHPADMEADPNQCFQDKDDDGYGDIDLSDAEIEAGVIAGTDCYDSSYGGADTYPGAGFNETGDLATACVEDEDMDGYGDMSPLTSYDIVAGTDCDDSDETLNPAVDGDSDGVNYCVDCDDTDATNINEQFEAFEDKDDDGFGSTSEWTCSLETDLDGDAFSYTMVVIGGDCWDSSYSPDAAYTFPGAAENETGTTEDGELLSELCLTDADEDGLGDADASSSADADGTDCDDDDAAAGVGVWAYDDADEDGFGDDDTFGYVCSLDSDGDSKNDMVEVGGDCDDTPATVDETSGDITDFGGSQTFPGAAENDSADVCLTDNDGDGYGADNEVLGLYEGVVVTGDTMEITVSDAYGDSCSGSADIYVDYVWVASYEGPAYDDADASVSYTHTFDTDGTVQIGWTSGGYFNLECGLDITDSAGTSLYSLAGCASSSTCTHDGPEPTVPVQGVGTDSDDSDASVQ